VVFRVLSRLPNWACLIGQTGYQTSVVLRGSILQQTHLVSPTMWDGACMPMRSTRLAPLVKLPIPHASICKGNSQLRPLLEVPHMTAASDRWQSLWSD